MTMEVAETARGGRGRRGLGVLVAGVLGVLVAGMAMEVAETARGVGRVLAKVAETQERAREVTGMLVRWSRSLEGEVAKVLGRWRWRSPETARKIAGVLLKVVGTATGVAGVLREVRHLKQPRKPGMANRTNLTRF